MKKILWLFISISNFVFAQNNVTYNIVYEKSNNGKIDSHAEKVLVFANIEQCLITTHLQLDKKATFPYEETLIKNHTVMQFAQLSENETVQTKDSTLLQKYNLEITQESKKILGYTCYKAKTTINSNLYEIWYTKELGINASSSILGYQLGTVLETSRNGNYLVKAIEIKKTKQDVFTKFINKYKFYNTLEYRDLIWKSRYTTIPIFTKETINYSDDTTSNDSILRFAHGTVIVRKIKFPKLTAKDGIYLQVKQKSNGDAYDRTGSVFAMLADEPKTFFNGMQNGINTLPIYDIGNGKKYQGYVTDGHYIPAVELMRFFTSFGISQYNTIEIKGKEWFKENYYRQDISDFTAYFSEKEVFIGAYIGNYDKGGHNVDIEITLHKDGALQQFTKVIPIFNTTNLMEMGEQEYSTLFESEKGLEVHFTLKEDLKNAKLRFITSGHGGWENGDEYLPKVNSIFLDGKEAFAFIPWRTECGSYRLYNPASGNFENGLSSSDYSRSNWCPGTVTNPEYLNLGILSAGNHTITIKIPQGKPEGTSFSYWNVSGVLLGD